MKKILVLLCLVFSGFIYAENSGGSSVSIPYIICMQDGKMLSTSAVEVYECDKLKAELAEKEKAKY